MDSPELRDVEIITRFETIQPEAAIAQIAKALNVTVDKLLTKMPKLADFDGAVAIEKYQDGYAESKEFKRYSVRPLDSTGCDFLYVFTVGPGVGYPGVDDVIQDESPRVLNDNFDLIRSRRDTYSHHLFDGKVLTMNAIVTNTWMRINVWEGVGKGADVGHIEFNYYEDSFDLFYRGLKYSGSKSVGFKKALEKLFELRRKWHQSDIADRVRRVLSGAKSEERVLTVREKAKISALLEGGDDTFGNIEDYGFYGLIAQHRKYIEGLVGEY